MKKEIFMVPYAHLDTQWRWEYPTTIKKYIRNTLEENIAMFKKYPEHRFNFTGALRFRMMQEYYPDLFEEVKKLVAEGKWTLAGTCLDETDALVPSVESTVRNMLYGNQWQLETFGVSSRDYMIPDCFGFPANFPTVMNHCGIIGFSSQKLSWGSAVGVPFELGIWEGPDGSGVVSALNPGRYIARVNLPIYVSPDRLGKLKRLGKKNGIWKSFQYYGVGDIGGAPRERSIKQTIKSIKKSKNKDIQVSQGSPTEFFLRVTSEERGKMDTYQGDFLLVNHSAGSITSATAMKRWNRKNEKLAFAAEAAAVTALHVAGTPYPQDKIASAWYRVIGSQMHDILPGTSTPLAYEYAHNDEVLALKTFHTVLEDSAQAVAPYVKGSGEILLFNPSSDSREDRVTLVLPKDFVEDGQRIQSLVDAEGVAYPVDIRMEEDQQIVTALPKLQPFEWKRYTLSAEPATIESDLTLTQENNSYILENSFLRVTLGAQGKISSLYNKSLKREMLKRPLAYELQREKPLKYPAWNMDWKDRKKGPFLRIEEGESVRIVEETPLVVTLEVEIPIGKSLCKKEISLAKGSEVLEITDRIQWQERSCALKLAVTLDSSAPKSTYNWESSRIERGINREKQFEVPSRYWADLSGPEGGISLIEDSKYGYDRPSEDTLRMTLIYTPAARTVTGYLDQSSQDWGEHTIRYGLYTHGGDRAKTDYYAELLNQRVRSFLVESDVDVSSETADSDTTPTILPTSIVTPICTKSSQDMQIFTVKRAENGKGVVVRVGERKGEHLSGSIAFAAPIVGATQVNGLEESIGEASFVGNELKVSIPANGIVAYLVEVEEQPKAVTSVITQEEDSASEQREEKTVQVPQKPLNLSFDTKLIGTHEDTHEPVMLPLDQVPSVIEAGAVSYQLSPESDRNALIAKGQHLAIPQGCNRIHLLMSGTQERTYTFEWLNEQGDTIEHLEQRIGAISGYIGLHDTRIWKREPTHQHKLKRDYLWKNPCVGVISGYIQEDRVEMYTTHIHKDGEDQPYEYGYLYTVELRVPEGATILQLPKIPRDEQGQGMESVGNDKTSGNKKTDGGSISLYLLAATVSQEHTTVTPVMYRTDKFDI